MDTGQEAIASLCVFAIKPQQYVIVLHGWLRLAETGLCFLSLLPTYNIEGKTTEKGPL